MKYELVAIEERPYKPWREHDLVEVFAVIRRHGEGMEIVFSDVFKREEWPEKRDEFEDRCAKRIHERFGQTK